jgi:hypothetical protein
MSRILILAALAGILSGCATAPAPKGNVYSASYVGDRDTVQLDEIVVSVPKQGNDTLIRNLHVFFAAVINPTRASTANEYDAKEIIHRAYTRIAAQLIDDVASGRIDTSKGLSDIRVQLLASATKTFTPIFSTWSHSEDMSVEIIITSLFFTDGSVGKSSPQNRFW